MKVLHLYPKNDSLIERHVAYLTEGMRQSADVKKADNVGLFRQILKDMEPDIVHVHGCWQYGIARASTSAIKHGARLIITLHGQLEPWIMKQKSLQENIFKTLLWQRSTIEQAYAIITLGKLERANFLKLGWNKRIEKIHNAVITNTISQAEMCSNTFAVYQKVMDSNTLEQMNQDSILALAAIIKAGITGDRRWLDGTQSMMFDPTNISWRQLLVYAEHENIRNYIDYGINILGFSTPLIDTKQIHAFFPDNYKKPLPVKELIGDYSGNESDYLMRIIRQINKHPLLLHLIELTRELYRNTVNDEQLIDLLEEKNLKSYAARLMQILQEQTLIDEGFMPLPPIDDKQTKHIRNLLTNHLKI